MRNSSPRYNNGFTLVEVLLTISILAVLASIVALSFNSFRANQAVSNGVDQVIALVNEARSRTLSADGGFVYGVHLNSSNVVLFQDTTYTPGESTNVTVPLNGAVTLESIALTGGGSDIIFNALTGNTDEPGSFIIKRVDSTAGQKTLTVTQAGTISSN